MTQPDPIMDKIAACQQQAVAGDRASARAQFAELWEQVGAEGDPLHVVSLAHYMADVQDDPFDELDWDLRALRAADELTDERAQQYHASLAIRGFYPSLHLNGPGSPEAGLKCKVAVGSAGAAGAGQRVGRLVHGSEAGFDVALD